MTCVLVSCLRAAGVPSGDVFAAVGTRRRTLKVDALEQPHAWAAVRVDGGLLWIDPADLEARLKTGEDLLASYHLFVLFSDQALAFGEREKQELLHGPEVQPRLYLFGRMDADLWALARSPQVMALFRQLLRAGRAAGEPAAAAVYSRAVARGLLLRDGSEGFAPGPGVVLVPAPAEAQLLRLVEPLLETYLGIVSETVPDLRRAWAASGAAGGFEWPEVAHAVVAGLFIDLAVGRRLEIARQVREEQGASALWIFETVSADNAFGVQWLRHDGQPDVFYQLWHRRTPRRPPTFDPRTVGLMARLARGEGAGSSVRELLLLRHFQLVAGMPGEPPRLRIPAFGPRDDELLRKPLQTGARRIVSEVIEPAFELAAGHPWWRRTASESPYRHAVVRLLLEYITDRALGARLLPPFPATGEDRPGWGQWLALEPAAASALRPASTVSAQERPCPAST